MRAMTATTDDPGPWAIAPDVAWVDGDHLLVLDVSAPYDRMPWLLDGPAAAIWELVAAGRTLAQIVTEDLADVADPDMPGQVAAFVADLRTRGLVLPAGPAG